MSKQLFDMKKSKDNKNDDDQDSFVGSFDGNNITTNSFHIAPEDYSDLEQYKIEIDKILSEKKEKLNKAYTFKKESAENKIKEEYDAKYKEDIEKEKEKLNQQLEKSSQTLEENYKRKTEEEKKKIDKQYKLEASKEKQGKIAEFNKKQEEMNKEIKALQLEYENLQREANYKEDEEEYERELKEIENQYRDEIVRYQSELDEKKVKKERELEEEYNRKKNEFESSMMQSMSNQFQQQQSNQDAVLQNKKNMLTKAQEAKLEHYKNSLINDYYRATEKEKNEILSNFEKEVNVVKENYEQMRNFYNQQKEIFRTEQSVITANAFLDKMKNIIDNKTTVFKSLLEQNHFMLKKKLKECENIKELASFSNKEVILNKISELLTMLFYSNIYEALYQDLNSEREMLSNHLEDLIRQCEGIIATFNSDKKIQLGMYLCNPNFN